MNSGDTIEILLNYTIDGQPIRQGDFDEIEFSIGTMRYTLTGGDIVWDSEQNAYIVNLPQKDTLALAGTNPYQTRLKKDGKVVSSGIKIIKIGESISTVEI